MITPLRAAVLAGALALGSPALAAAPAAGGPPDWTGIWTRVGSLNFDPTIPGAQPDRPPYNAAFAARFKTILEAEARGQPSNDKSAQCLPPGLVRMMNMVYPMEILQTRGQVTIIAEWMGQIYKFLGLTVGVIDTVALHGGGILDDHGAPLGETLHVTERFAQPDPDTLTDTFTIEDPQALTRPYTATKTFKRNRSIQMMEYVCEENNRNPVDANGVTGVKLINR